ncbi:SAM-dependent methyltransferase [Nocardioides immobilis]|uniref:SAM-dependent methyltransferase n=1 Tax=Nocardioides immobilis TaxID=2049295 RepID=A0A417Y6Y6_9ACTN|nr:class I SAM-dependent methyltransferase [Nocardioides immobilis]RHW28256.1 SAM-dependent methyltransferase [Nocardioides immobilis]
MDLGERIAAWDAEAEAYDEPADHGLTDPSVRSAWHDLLVHVLPPAPARVADLGCGTGTLSLLLAKAGYSVDGLDFSPAMVAQARVKLAGLAGVTVTESDAYAPRLAPSSYDAVLCRHVLWAMPDPSVALDRWVRLLVPGGRLVLVEGSWSTGAGLTAAQTVDLVRGTDLEPDLTMLDDPALWGGPTSDERYLVTATSPTRSPTRPAAPGPGRRA